MATKTTPVHKLKAPFPWFGGKSRVSHIVWERFGDAPNYVEPFAGSLAVLLGRPPEWPAREPGVAADRAAGREIPEILACATLSATGDAA